MVENLPFNAGDSGLIPGQGTKIRTAEGQLSLREKQLEKSLCALSLRTEMCVDPTCCNQDPTQPRANILFLKNQQC